VVGILCRDHRGTVLSLIAAGRLGARAVLLNTGFAKPQLTGVIEREGIAALLLDAELLPLTDPMPRVLTWAGDGAAPNGADVPTIDDLIEGRPTTAPPLPGEPGGLVLLTSGTTGTPKGAPRRRISPLQSAQLLDRIPLSRGAAMVIAAPLHHGTGMAQLAMGIGLGKEVVLRRAKFDPEATLAAVATHRADALILVPTMLRRIVELDPALRERYDVSSLRTVVCAGSSLSPDLCRRAAAALGDVLYNVYGSTEVANAAVATPAELRRAPGTVGRAPLGCRLVLYDKQRQPISAPETPGTIFASNGLSFSGYTDGGQKEIVDGMLSTGDIGHFDRGGLLFVDGRDDEMIVSGGENVFPLEVENLIAAHDDVCEAAAIGVEDPDFGQRLRVYVAPRADAELDAGEIKDYVKANLARHKVPRDVVFVEEIPRNAAGKVPRDWLQQD
jgi:fatty-acyl-CoA synthase